MHNSNGLYLKPSGDNLQVLIDDLGSSGGDIWLQFGSVEVSRWIYLNNSGIRIHGWGPRWTTLVFFDDKGFTNSESNPPNDILFEGFKITGRGNFQMIPGNNWMFNNIETVDITKSKYAFSFSRSDGQTVSNLILRDCHTKRTSSSGFCLNDPASSGVIFDGVLFENCSASYAGYGMGHGNWSVGFDFAEADKAFIIKNLSVIRCTADHAWESGFHFETEPHKYNCYFEDCVSYANGRKTIELGLNPLTPRATIYCSGFFGTMGCTFINCKAYENTKYGFWCSTNPENPQDHGVFFNCRSYNNGVGDYNPDCVS